MITILAGDQAMTSSGAVVLEHIPNLGKGNDCNEVVHVEVIRTNKGNDDFILDTFERASVIGRRLNQIADEHKPDYIVFETPSLASKGNATRTLPMLLGSLLAQLECHINREGVKLLTVPPTSLKKFATGKGNAGKDDMVHAVEQSNPELHEQLMAMPKSKGRYDLADAYWLAQWVISKEINEEQ